MKIVRLITAVVLMLAVLLPVTACSGIDYEPLELVPAGSELIGGIKVSETLRDWQIYCEIDGNEAQEEWFENKKDEFYENTGIDPNDISEAVFFGAMEGSESPEDMEYAAVILTGNFVDDGIVDRIAEKTGKTLTEEKIGDFSLFVSSDGEAAVLPVSNTMIIMGSPRACKDCIAVAGGEMDPISGPVLTNYNSLDDVIVKMSIIVPDEATSEFAADSDEMGMMPVGLQSFADMETIGISADLTATALTMKTSMGFSSPDSAVEAADAVNTLISFFAMMSTDESVAERMEGLDISASANAMVIRYEMTLAELAEMLEEMEDLEDMGGMEDFMIPPISPDISEDFETPDL